MDDVHAVVSSVEGQFPEELAKLGTQLFLVNNRSHGDEEDMMILVQGRIVSYEDEWKFLFETPIGTAFKPLSEIHSISKMVAFCGDAI